MLDRLEQFRSEQDARFRSMRDFYNSMVNANADLAEVRTFLRDYRTVEQERTSTEPERWNELSQSYQAAQAAVHDQIEAWRNQAQAQLSTLNAELERPCAARACRRTRCAMRLRALSDLYDAGAPSAGTGRQVVWRGACPCCPTLLRCQDKKNDQLRELRARYRAGAAGERAGLTWRDLVAEPVRIGSPSGAWTTGWRDLRDRIAGYLHEGKTVIIQ